MSLKKILALLLALAMVLSITACSSDSNEATDEGSQSTAEEGTEDSDKIKVGFCSAAFSDEWCHNLAMAFEELSRNILRSKSRL